MAEVARKVLVVGIDGGEWSLLQQWLEQLPNLHRLLRQGVGGTLRVPLPPVTCPCWPSFYTGKNPGQHGVFAFRQKQPGRYEERFVNRTHVRAEPLWDVLARHGKRSIVVNLPVTYPPYPIHGVLVTDMLTPATAEVFSFPAEVGAELHQVCQGYVIEATQPPPATDEQRDLLIAGYLEALRKRTQAMKHLLTSRAWDFAVVVYRATDVLAHHFWQYFDPQHPGYDPNAPLRFRQALPRAYEAVDEGVGELLKAIPDGTTVVVLSDHGFGPRLGTFAINEWLRAHGFLALQRPRGWSPRTFLARRNVTIHSLKRLFDRLGPLKQAYRLLPKPARDQLVTDHWQALDLGLDWARTRAYAGNETGTQIYLNVRGREPEGIVSPGAEYEALRAEIAHALENEFAARTEPPCSVQVYRREEIYRGPYLEMAPDLLVFVDEGAWEHAIPVQRPLFQPFTPGQKAWSGSHRPLGLFILAGEGIRAQGSPAEADILDLAPTILHLFGLPIPDDFDGRPLLEHLSGQRDPCYVPAVAPALSPQGFSATEEASVEQRLRDLGYL